MNRCQIHRGPDESGTYIDGPIGLAHRRLSVVGLDTGDQPVFNEDKSVAVVFNGEIYNHEQLRSQLRNKGHDFSTSTDTEVLVHCYEEHGEEFVKRINGMFAFAIWDSSAKQLLLARDNMGIKPLYLGREPDGRFAFASELSALFPLDFDLGGLHKGAIAEYFAFGYIPAPKTAFQNVTKLRPGERVVIGGDRIDRSRFYRPSIEPVNKGFQNAASELRERLEESVEQRLQADVPLGAFLSGGIDSSIITGILARLRDGPVNTFSIGFDEAQFDETWAAREVASFHGTNHHEYTVLPSDVRTVIDEVVPTMGEPFADSSILPTYVVSENTRREITVALSGDGADELFSGYNKYRGEFYSKYYRSLPQSIRDHLIAPCANRLPASKGSKAGETVRKVQKFARGAEADRCQRQYQWMAVTTPETEAGVPSLEVSERGLERVEDAQDGALRALPPTRQDDLTVMQMTDARFALPDGILAKVDRASMLNSLEVRVPFLDTAVFEYAMGLPRSYKITHRSQKRILKSAFDDLLPGSILKRGKQGFEVPIGEWFKNELRSDFLTLVEGTHSGIVSRSRIREIYHQHVNGSRDHSKFLWAIFVYLHWKRRMKDEDIL
jgi:asparagine synthase (glutamine-hydrolysing)